MTEVDDFKNLPAYIRRHLSTRYAVSEESVYWPSPEYGAWHIRFALDDRQAQGLKYLTATIRDIRFAGYSTPDLINMLVKLPTDGTAAIVITELVRRLSDLDDISKSQLSEALGQLAADMQPQASQRTIVDRAAMRLLYHLDHRQAFPAAVACARSPRAIRREASYRFYLANGIDEAGREALAEKVRNASTRYRQVITTDSTLVKEMGLARVLELAPSTYWRKIAITGALDKDNCSDVLDICADYPLELVWAINENRLVNLLPHVMKLLEKYKDDAYLLNRILQCLARLGDKNSLSQGMQYAANLLSRESTNPATSTDSCSNFSISPLISSGRASSRVRVKVRTRLRLAGQMSWFVMIFVGLQAARRASSATLTPALGPVRWRG